MVEYEHDRIQTWWNTDTVKFRKGQGGMQTRWNMDMVEQRHGEMYTR